ncbi:hypothetical protein DPV78_011776 [Talaromyces pinophilus]|nr:hypothetical protein DPV78_011776 [Talaromyces pinophilus]
MHQVAVKSRESDRSASEMDQTGINSTDLPPSLGPLEILPSTPNTSIEIETQQPPTPTQIDSWHDFESTTEVSADILHESPPSTIPFDEHSPPRRLSSEPLPPSQGVGDMANSPSPVVNFKTDDEDDPAHRPDYAISARSLRKQKREDLDAVDFRSKLRQLVKEVLELHEALEEKNKQLIQERRQRQKTRKFYKFKSNFYSDKSPSESRATF